MQAAHRTSPGRILLPNIAAMLAMSAGANETRTAGRRDPLGDRVRKKLAQSGRVTRTAGCDDDCSDNGGCNSHQDGLWAPMKPANRDAKQMFHRYVGVSTRDNASGQLVNGVEVAPLGTATITVSPQIPIVPKCFQVPSYVAPFFRILQMTIGVAPAIIGGQGVPAMMFSEVETCNMSHLNRICADTNLVVIVQNLDPVQSYAFDAGIKGTSDR